MSNRGVRKIERERERLIENEKKRKETEGERTDGAFEIEEIERH
jgi:hypothetical protein